MTKSDASIELSLPDKTVVDTNVNIVVVNKNNSFNSEIIKNNTTNTLLGSMNKEQIAEQCINLLSKELKNQLTLELATVNCVVSNHQATFQKTKEINNALKLKINKNKVLVSQQCRNQYNQNPQYSILEKQLLVGICVSDKLNIN